MEHSRIYRFGEGKDAELFISSADLMTRNIERRVEIAAPILDEKIKSTVSKMLEIMLADNVKGRMLTSRGRYIKPQTAEGEERTDSQEYFLNHEI